MIQAAIIGISLKDLFDMELWQFICYLEGFRRRQIYDQINSVISSARTGQYVGQYWTGKRAPDANNIINKLYAEIENKNLSTVEDDDKVAEDKINQLKNNLKMFD